ncbi:hypothetical protein ACHQM5_012695 [Ranunculus cassubicifolius]
MCSETSNPVQLDHRNDNDDTNSSQLWLRNRSSGDDEDSPRKLQEVERDDSVAKDKDLVVVQGVPLHGTNVSYGPQHQHLQQQPEPELVGHSIACAPYPYMDPYYAGIMTAYGVPPMVNPQLLGMHPARMPLPLEMTEEPVYVNAKQYNGIMRRRQSRAKAELERKLIKERKPYLHESRHQHAMRRQRGCGGRFLKKKPKEGSKSATEQVTGSGEPQNTQSASPPNSSGQEKNDFRSSQRREEGDCSGQLRGNMLDRQPSHRALTIK